MKAPMKKNIVGTAVLVLFGFVIITLLVYYPLVQNIDGPEAVRSVRILNSLLVLVGLMIPISLMIFGNQGEETKTKGSLPAFGLLSAAFVLKVTEALIVLGSASGNVFYPAAAFMRWSTRLNWMVVLLILFAIYKIGAELLTGNRGNQLRRR